MIVWLVLTCHEAAVFSALFYCPCLWGNVHNETDQFKKSFSVQFSLFFPSQTQSLYLCSVFVLFCLFFWFPFKYILFFLCEKRGLVCSRDEDDSSTALLLLLVLWGPHSTHNGHRHVELTPWSQKNVVFILTLPALCLFSHHSSLVAVFTSAVFCSDIMKICACVLVWRKSQSWIDSLLAFSFF